MNIETEVFRGNRLADDEVLVWRGQPAWRGLACDAFHLRGFAFYFACLVALDGFQAWSKQMTFADTLHRSVPLFCVIAAAFGMITLLAWMTARATRYTITNRRVILHYGVAMPATLSLPYAQIARASIAVKGDHSGDIPLVLKSDNRMPYLKLWPLARPWRVSQPEPMLRRVPRVAVVGGLLARAIAASAHDAEALRGEANACPIVSAEAVVEPSRALLTA